MSTNLGLYIHIPFCSSKCNYYHFASGVFPKSLIQPYLNALKHEIEAFPIFLEKLNTTNCSISLEPVDSIYLGGGTPSLIDEKEISSILDFIERHFSKSPDAEVTIEVNPGTLKAKKIESYLEAGINRISVGVQSFQDRLLKQVGRSHSSQETLATIELCRQQGFTNMNLDLIAGLPTQSEEDWQENLEQVVSLSPEHLSLYSLEVHDNTILGRQSLGQQESQGCGEFPDEELVARFYEQSVDHLESAGWGQYEISNFCKPGYHSRHNLKYWTDRPFIGFGCGAHSYCAGWRWGNDRDPSRYVKLQDQQGDAVDFRMELTPRQHLEEVIFLGLRLNIGLDLTRLHRAFGFDLSERFGVQISRLVEGQLLEIEEDQLKLTPRGRLLANEVFVEFMQ